MRYTSAVATTVRADAAKRGHIMFMHNPDVDVRYVQFDHLGRTRKDIHVTNGFNDPMNPGTNPRGRYAMHVHRSGKDDTSAVQIQAAPERSGAALLYIRMYSDGAYHLSTVCMFEAYPLNGFNKN